MPVLPGLIPWLRRHRDPRPPAQAPGDLTYVGERRVDNVSFRVLDYSTAEMRELSAEHPADCVEFEGRDSPTWIMVTGLHDTDKIQELLTAYEIHPLIQQDILNTEHHPKVDDFGHYLFITARQITLCDTAAKFEVQQFSMIVTDRVLISFHEAPSAIFDPVVARLRDGKGKLRSAGVDYLAWALLDAVMDHYLLALDRFEDDISQLDERLANSNADVTMQEIHAIRAQTSFLYRAIRPMREVAIALQRNEGELLSPALQPFIRDLYDHAWHAIETADHLREAITAIREFYQANLAQRMNEIMKVLTALSTIFLPLSFLAGIWGMNFEFMPELKWLHGYHLALCLFGSVAFFMLWYFKRKRWL
jgi:magnesium transporter